MGADTIGTLQVFKTLIENPVTRNILSNLCKYCPRDKGNRLDIALQLYTGAREKACLSCRIGEILLAPILEVACRAFGVTHQQLKERFHDPYWRRALVDVIKGLAWFGVSRPFVPGAPFQVVWNVTRICNLKCKHCYESAGSRGEDELSTEDAKRVIDILSDAGVVILAFSGGEPTLRPDILDLVRYATDRGLYVAMATNAILLSSRERVIEFKKAGLQFVQISLDGANPETHDSFRGVPGAFEKTVQGIKNCVAEGLFVEIATVATHLNYKEIPEMVDLANELGVDWLMIYNFIPTGRGAYMDEDDLTPDEREWLLEYLWSRLESSKTSLLSTAPQFARVAKQMIDASKSMKESHGIIHPTHFYNAHLSGQLENLAQFIGGCGAGRFYISLEPNGDMYPCVFFPHDEEVRLGNILEDDFEEIWRHSKLLQELRNKDLLMDHCGSCEYRYICGGCRARAYNYFGDVRAPDPGCINNKRYWVMLRGRGRKEAELLEGLGEPIPSHVGLKHEG